MSVEITCRFCEKFCSSKWRTSPDSDSEGKKSSIAKSRYCAHIDKYISGERPSCDDFKPYHLFYCDRNNQWQHVEACLSRAKKGLDVECDKCPQHPVIVNVQRARFFLKRRIELAQIEADKPKLIRRVQ